jgi:hypothetical protein
MAPINSIADVSGKQILKFCGFWIAHISYSTMLMAQLRTS